MRILLLYQYWHTPDHGAACRYYHLTDYLSEENDVFVISSNSYFKDRVSHHYPDKPPKVGLHLSKVPYSNKMGFLGRLVSYSLFSLKVIWHATRRKSDVIWAVSTPLTVPAAASFISKIKNRPWVFEVSDLWPDFPIQMGAINNSFVRKMLYKLELMLYRSADHIVSKSPDITSHIVGLGIDPNKVTTTYNGTEFDTYDRSLYQGSVERSFDELNVKGKKIVLYAGTFGRANDFENILETVKHLKDDEQIHFVFAGWGFHEKDIRALMDVQDNLSLIGLQSRPQTLEWLRLADLSLVSFKDLPVLKTNSPTKFYDSLGVGTPVIVTNDGWTKTFVEQHECGWFVSAGHSKQLADKLKRVFSNKAEIDQYSKNAETVARKLFDRKEMVPVFQNIFSELTN